jgi:hypothetical protein
MRLRTAMAVRVGACALFFVFLAGGYTYDMYYTRTRRQLAHTHGSPARKAASPLLLQALAQGYAWEDEPATQPPAGPPRPEVVPMGSGALGAEGTWPVVPGALGTPCTVLSVGIKDDYSFDLAVSETYGCEVHAFDPTVAYPKTLDAAGRVHFDRVGLAGRPRGDNLVDLPTAMRRANVTYVDVLKVDCEGCEYDVFRHLAATLPTFFADHVGQFLFELHLGDRFPSFYRETLERGTDAKAEGIIDYLHANGFEMFYFHNNPVSSFHAYRGLYVNSCFEMGWISTRGRD